MKKLIFLLSLILIVGCSTDSVERNNTAQLTPPNWIQGTYLLETGSNTINFGYTFTGDDIIVINISSQTSLKSTLVEGTSVNQVIQEDYYEVRLVYPNGTDALYEFQKVDDTHILNSGNVTLTKQ